MKTFKEFLNENGSIWKHKKTGALIHLHVDYPHFREQGTNKKMSMKSVIKNYDRVK